MVAQLDRDYIRTRPLEAMSRFISYALLEGRPLTTRGRWINSILFAQFALVKRLPQLKKVEKPIFILGIGRSGSTILGKVLSMHEQLCFLNEPKALWHVVCPEGDLVGSYSRDPGRYRFDAQDVTSEMCEAARRLYGYCLSITGSQRILDKYPEMIFRVPFIQKIFPDAKLIFLTRNGWDTTCSISTWTQRYGQRVEQERHDWWGVNQRKWHLLVQEVVANDPQLAKVYSEIETFTRPEDKATVEWVVNMREGLRILHSKPEHMVQVKYEEIVKRPKRTLEKLLDFCELPKDEVCISYARQKLAPVPAKPRFSLHPVIQEVFLETMGALGYSVN